jgi:hypothetical protein
VDADADTDADPAIFVIDLQDAQKINLIKKFFCFLLLKVHLHHFSKIRSHKAIGTKVFLTIFAW